MEIERKKLFGANKDRLRSISSSHSYAGIIRIRFRGRPALRRDLSASWLPLVAVSIGPIDR